EPRFDDEEADVQRALEESLKSVYDAPRGPLPPVVIREPEFRNINRFQRLTDSEVESDEDLPWIDGGVQDEGQAGPNPDEQDEGQAESSPVVHAGPNFEHMNLEAMDVSTQLHPKQMDEGFTATTYPNVQENLKLIAKEQVIIEEPASFTGTLSSLQHLAKDLSFGDLFFNDKPSEADNEKITLETEAESMIQVAQKKVKKAFENADSSSRVELIPSKIKVYKVEKAMYGLHQALRAWYGTLSKYLFDNGFQRGLQVLQKKDGIFLSQDKYVGDILKKFGYTNIRAAKTPMDKENPWEKDETGKDVELQLYRSMIGSLMYLTASRPDIMFAVCAYAKHQVTPKECHLYIVKRIFRYLKGNPKLGLWYPKESPFDLVAYSNSDYGGANQDRKPTTRGCRFLGRRLFSWQCKKQTIVTTSTTEAEYVAATSGCG
nr:hypothetical protein [Tanacetum cinerariifolium]